MERFRGMIALDIDGTITVERHSLEREVSDFLNRLMNEGWLLAFVTGRTFSFAKPILSSLKGTYYFAVQNGAALYRMPEEALIRKNYIPIHFLSDLEEFFNKEHLGLLVETGREREDVCFYKPKDFSKEDREYIRFRIEISPERWEALDSFKQLDINDFAVGKFFAKEKIARKLAKEIEKNPAFKVIVIRDPFREGFYLAHINDKDASKGKAISDLAKKYPLKIAAGDDDNDLDMLKLAEVKVVMENAPDALLEIADKIAPHARKQGIIPALTEVLSRWKG